VSIIETGDEILPYLRCLLLIEFTLCCLVMLVKWKGHFEEKGRHSSLHREETGRNASREAA